jgi:uncharacterized protein YxeA
MKRILITVLLSLLFSACGGYNEGIVQKSEKGFIKFTGNTAQIILKIDDGKPFQYNRENPVYQVKPGKHTVQVIRNDKVIVNRTVLIDNQTTMEIEVP